MLHEKEECTRWERIKRSTQKREGFVCPVCKRPLPEDNLVDMGSVVEDNMYYAGGIRIVNSRIVLHCDCEHQCDEEGLKLDNPHKVVAVVNAEFDDEGSCVHFEIKEVLAGKG